MNVSYLEKFYAKSALSPQDQEVDDKASEGPEDPNDELSRRVALNRPVDRFILSQPSQGCLRKPLKELDPTRLTAYDHALSQVFSIAPARSSRHAIAAKRITHQLDKTPCQLECDRVLDAPYLRDDFYCSLMSVSKTHMGILLGDELYLTPHRAPRKKLGGLISCHVDEQTSAVGFVCGRWVCGDASGKVRLMRLVRGEKGKELRLGPLVQSKEAGPFRAAVTSIAQLDRQHFVYGMRDNAGIVVAKIGRNAQRRTEACQVQQIELPGYVGGLASQVFKKKVYLAVGKNNGVAEIFEFVKGQLKPVQQLKGVERGQNPRPEHRGGGKLAWHPKKTVLVVGGGINDKSVKLWKRCAGVFQCVHTIMVEGQITNCVWSKNGKRLAVSTGFGGGVPFINVYGVGLNRQSRYQSTLLTSVPSRNHGRIASLQMSPTGDVLYSALTAGRVPGTEEKDLDELLVVYRGFNSKPTQALAPRRRKPSKLSMYRDIR